MIDIITPERNQRVRLGLARCVHVEMLADDVADLFCHHTSGDQLAAGYGNKALDVITLSVVEALKSPAEIALRTALGGDQRACGGIDRLDGDFRHSGKRWRSLTGNLDIIFCPAQFLPQRRWNHAVDPIQHVPGLALLVPRR